MHSSWHELDYVWIGSIAYEFFLATYLHQGKEGAKVKKIKEQAKKIKE